ncbi:amino acid transporter [Arthrobacter sp. V1I9]|uniref:APC family permease n=1 Tax=Arthrobacter sp. V1I9 TaxID=3042275 RepID=UPI0027918C82|nr:APC family permease [Arthrobacter sp. V1I9]MDQ0867808.1 amino acid transporter [Arthrobacter sp. V1I9]
MATITKEAANVQADLKGNLGLFHLFFTVMAWNAPLVIVFAAIPIVVGYGNGIGAAGAFIIAGVTIGLFALGFTRMTKILPTPGAFYAYITAGLGKKLGLGSGLLTLIGYFAAYAGTFAFGGVVSNQLFHDTLGLPELPWYLWGVILWFLVAILGLLKFSLSATLLTVFLGLEILVIVIYNIAVFMQGGATGVISADPLIPANWVNGSVAMAMLFAIGMFGGFEITALFRSEVRNPSRTVPVATYMVVIVATLMYAVTSWAFVNAAGINDAVVQAAGDPTGTMHATFLTFGGKLLSDISSVLVFTSTFAVILAGHNIVSRYLFNLGADGILPKQLSMVHAKQGSPYRASLAASLACLVVNIAAVLANVDPVAFYAAMLGMTSLVLIVILLICDGAILVYLHRHGRDQFSVFPRVIAPSVAAVGLGICAYLAITNFNALTGGSQALSTALMVFLGVVFLGGILLASAFKRTKPQVYARIGRQ